ncbi:MAG: translation initiation factor IF-2 [Deltaproteobacteria bacterium]|jgi:translation initiation factor IF-2|nr:translation initiation factor IF-2 [Deltaproteobacteria bacterium]
MSDKIRVKELSVELSVPVKDLLALIKSLNIPAKAVNSILAEEEVVRIKERLTQSVVAEKRKNVDFIVRRRRKDAVVEEEAGAVPDVAPEAVVPTPAQTPAPEDAPTDGKEAAPDSAAAAGKTPAGEERTGRGRSGKARSPRPTAPARVLSLPSAGRGTGPDEAQPAPERKAQPERRISAPNFSADPETDASGLPLSSTPKFAGQAAGAVRQGGEGLEDATGARDGASPRTERDKPRPGRTEHEPSRTVRVISRPAEQPARGAEGRPDRRPERAPRPDRPDRPGVGRGTGPRQDWQRPGAGTDARPPRPAGRYGSDLPAPGGALPLPGEGESRNKKRLKGKRTVEFTEDRRFKSMDGDEDRMRSTRRGKGRKAAAEAKVPATLPVKAAKRKIRMEEFIRVADLAHQMGLKAGEIIKVLFNLGVMATINQSLDFETAVLVASEFSYEVENVGFSEDDFLSVKEEDQPEQLITRPPVVTIMGHVDHGKTSMLDAIRKTSVTSGEAGGITQHIGAYHVHTPKGDIVFLDTPGHEAFTAMRARGAEVTDIVVLVVAADDGVMEQTREAINHARAAQVPIMVAVNKMDKEEANPDRIKRELADLGMVAEEWGGDTTFSYLSAKTRAGLDEFLELLALQAEILELKANPDRAARGHIVEAKLDKGRGALGTVLIQQGTLHVGDAFVCGVHHGRVRALFDDQGGKVDKAGPSMPVEVQGFEGVPEAGEEFICLADEKAARRIAETRAMKQRERELAKESKVTLETFLASRAGADEALTLNLVLKADVQGSLEAIQDQLKKLSTAKVRLNVVHSGAGAISESDVLLAAASEAIIIGFNVRPNAKTKELAEQEKIDLRFYDIIYKLVEEIRSAMEGMLSPVSKEVFVGTAEVRQTYNVPKAGTVAGCMVAEGKITRTSQIRLLRDGVVAHTGRIASLRRFKEDTREVLKGYECGIGLENFNDVKVGDVIEAFDIVEEAARL